MASERRRLHTIAAFRKDLKALKRKHYDMGLLREPIDALISGDGELLARRYRDHALTGGWKGYRELHVQGDWLIVYFIDDDSVTLVLARSGSHDELFGAKMGRKEINALLKAPRERLS